jgi:hypothetical protein
MKVTKDNAVVGLKVGDWVTVIDTNIGKPHETIAFKSGVLTSKITEVCSSKDYRYRVNGIWCDVRKATPSEIFEALKVERDEFAGQLLKDLHGVSPSDKHLKYPLVSEECCIGLPIISKRKSSNIVELKLEKQKSLINLPK